MQSKRGLLAETIISTVVGLILSLMMQLMIFPLYGIYLQFHQDLQIVAIFTIASIARGYVLRRMFNNITVRKMVYGKNRDQKKCSNTSTSEQ